MSRSTTRRTNNAGAVFYAANVLGSRGPRRMQVYLPRIAQRDNAVVPWREPQEMCVVVV